MLYTPKHTHTHRHTHTNTLKKHLTQRRTHSVSPVKTQLCWVRGSISMCFISKWTMFKVTTPRGLFALTQDKITTLNTLLLIVCKTELLRGVHCELLCDQAWMVELIKYTIYNMNCGAVSYCNHCTRWYIISFFNTSIPKRY